MRGYPPGMERKSWTVEADGTTHAVVLNWTYYGGERQVNVDGRVVDDDARAFRWKSRQEFVLAGRTAVVETKPLKRLSPFFTISLHVDGREVAADPGKRSRWER